MRRGPQAAVGTVFRCVEDHRLVLPRAEWLDEARKLDWELSYVREEEAFPVVQAGRPWLVRSAWAGWDEPYRTTFADYVTHQAAKDTSVEAVRDAVGPPEDYKRLDPLGLLLASDAIEFAIATNFVFETGFTNLQFVGLSALARETGDHTFERIVSSIQSDEARHAQIGRPVLEVVVREDPAYAQKLVDKWFWRSWLLFAVVTGFAM